ncbi:MAG: hypothetical protein ABI333_11385 [bacterium]
MKQSHFLRHAVVLTALLAGACTPKGDYRISWSFSDTESLDPFICSSRGVEKVDVRLINTSDGSVHLSMYACGQGGTDIQSLEEGTYRVEVRALSPAGSPFTDPSTGEPAMFETVAELIIADDGNVSEASVVFTPVPQCTDGVDNDADGLVDAADPGCRDKDGVYDATLNNEENVDTPGLLSVAWVINGGESCSDVQPDGARALSVLVDDFEVERLSCAAGTGTIPLRTGPHTVALTLLDASDLELATTPAQSATLIQDVTTSLDFDFTLDTFAAPQTGSFTFQLSWITAGQTCSDASPMVTTQSLWLQDDQGVTVDATTLAGTSVDNTATSEGTCIEASVLQGLTTYIPAGTYTLTVTGFEPGSDPCWDATFPDLEVGLGPNAPFDLVVPQTDATGNCAP